MLDLIVEFFPWDWILWTMQEKIKKLVFNYLTRVTNRGESIVVGSLIISSSLNHEFVWLLIRISTNSFWASAVTGRIPEGCKWPLARAEIWKWKEKKRERERDPATRFDWGLSYVWFTAFKNLFQYSNSSLFVDIAVCRFNTNIQATKWLVSKYMILLFK